MPIQITINMFGNGTWEAKAQSGAVKVSALGPSPADACIEVLDQLGIDGIKLHIERIKDRLAEEDYELELLRADYSGLASHVGLIKHKVKQLAAEAESLTGTGRKYLEDLVGLTEPWPKNR